MPDAYQLEIERPAQKDILALPTRSQERVMAVIESLTTDPRPRGTLKLKGRGNGYRIRVGEYRVLYAVFDADRLVKVTDVERRTDQTYRRLDR